MKLTTLPVLSIFLLLVAGQSAFAVAVPTDGDGKTAETASWTTETETQLRAIMAGLRNSLEADSRYTGRVVRTIHKIDREIGPEYRRHDTRVRYDNGKLWHQLVDSEGTVKTVYRDGDVYVNYGGEMHGQIDMHSYEQFERGGVEEFWDLRTLPFSNHPSPQFSMDALFTVPDDLSSVLRSLSVEETTVDGLEAWKVRTSAKNEDPEDWSEFAVDRKNFRILLDRGYLSGLYAYERRLVYRDDSESAIPERVDYIETEPESDTVTQHVSYEILEYDPDGEIPEDTFTLASIRPVGITPVNNLRSHARIGYWDNGNVVPEPPNAKRLNRQQSLADTPAVAGRDPGSSGVLWWGLGAVVVTGTAFLIGRRFA